MNFFTRVVQNMANELITKRLANSPTFQRFAYKSVKHVEKLKDVASEKGVDALKQAAEKGTTGVGHAAGFFSEVKRGFVEDLNAVASKLGKK